MERAAGEQIAMLRSIGYAAFDRHDPDVGVLDLVFDSLVDTPGSEGVRRLRFTGYGVTMDVERTEVGVELRVLPAGPVVVEACGDEATRLVSFLLRWPAGTQRSVRTAWVML
ncbi:hypothetical protein ACXJJ3_07330 [Kribbella sp. WER1]